MTLSTVLRRKYEMDFQHAILTVPDINTLYGYTRFDS